MPDHDDDRPVALDAYEAMAEEYAARVETKPFNAYYERPATLSLLPEVRGLHVLDAGCGPGVYAEWLVTHGARVTGIDVSPKMLALARQRLGNRAALFLGDLGKPLDFLSDASFDLIIAPLVLHYVRDWDHVFGEFARLLKPGGVLVFSIHHPTHDLIYFQPDDYFATELMTDVWDSFGKPVTVRYYRRPLNAVFAPLLGAGFILERFLEPQPTARFKECAPENYEKFSRQPLFLCIRARKP